jgi:hypothetical protein
VIVDLFKRTKRNFNAKERDRSLALFLPPFLRPRMRNVVRVDDVHHRKMRVLLSVAQRRMAQALTSRRRAMQDARRNMVRSFGGSWGSRRRRGGVKVRGESRMSMTRTLDGPLEPWYGSWPPEMKGEADMEETTLRRWFIPALLFIGLVVFLFLWSQIEHHELRGFWWDFLKRLSEAGVIAMILALTVDVLLKKEFGRDVFLASIGYVLPKELRPEMRG